MTGEECLAYIAQKHHVSHEAILSHDRHRYVVEARHDLCRTLRAHGWPLQAIGAFIGRDHTTVSYALRKADRK